MRRAMSAPRVSSLVAGEKKGWRGDRYALPTIRPQLILVCLVEVPDRFSNASGNTDDQ